MIDLGFESAKIRAEPLLLNDTFTASEKNMNNIKLLGSVLKTFKKYTEID